MRPQKEISIGEAFFVIEIGKLLFGTMMDGVCMLFNVFLKSKRAKVGAMIVSNLIFAPYTAPALAAVTVIGSAVVVMALPIIRLLEV